MSDSQKLNGICDDRTCIEMLLQSAPHPLMDRILHRPKSLSLSSPPTKYTIEPCHMPSKPSKLRICTVDDIDSRTVCTQALFFACWTGNIKLVKRILGDLRELINTILGGMSAIEWTLHYITHHCSKGTCPTSILKQGLIRSINKCKLLIDNYGLELNANYPTLLLNCIRCDRADTVVYLVTTYGSELRLDGSNNLVFSFLAMKGEDATAELYLRLHRGSIDNHSAYVLWPMLHRASAALFVSTINLLHSEIKLTDADRILTDLCNIRKPIEGRHGKVGAVLDVWAGRLSPGVERECLISCWYRSQSCNWETDTDCGWRIGQLIVDKAQRPLPAEWIGIALVLCFPAHESTCNPPRLPAPECKDSLQNLERLEALIDQNLAIIQQNPSCLNHALLECCSRRDLEAFNILIKCGSCMHAKALEFWCEIGDLEAVIMLFEIGNAELLACVPSAFISVCEQGDVELAELIIRFAGDSIMRLDYTKAFQCACYGGHGDVIQMLAETHPFYSDFYTNDTYDLRPEHIDPEIISLLNSIFDSRAEPMPGAEALSSVPYLTHVIEYPGWQDVHYAL